MLTSFNVIQISKPAGNPLYDNYLSGGEGWLGLRYSGYGFTGTVRFDAFQN